MIRSMRKLLLPIAFSALFFKVIKKGIGEGSIRTCFCTGVLPVTMDDLTSGYNIAEILTLEPNFLNMLGFTYEETETYLRYVLDKYAAGQDRKGDPGLCAPDFDAQPGPAGDLPFSDMMAERFFNLKSEQKKHRSWRCFLLRPRCG